MDPLKSASSLPHDISISAPIKGPVSSQSGKIPDLSEKGKAIFKAVVQTGSSTFEKVKNYFGGTSKLSASKYKEAVLKELPDSALKEQIKGLNSVNDIRKALLGSATADANLIDAIASLKGKTATAKSDLGKLQGAAIKIANRAKEKLSELTAPHDEAKIYRDNVLKNIDKELESNKRDELVSLREQVANSENISAVKVAVHKYQLFTDSQNSFEKENKIDPVQYKKAVLSQLDDSRNQAEIQNESTLNHDRLRKILEMLDSPADIQEAIAYTNIDNFDPDEVNNHAQEASRYTTNLEKLGEAAKTAIEKMRNLI